MFREPSRAVAAQSRRVPVESDGYAAFEGEIASGRGAVAPRTKPTNLVIPLTLAAWLGATITNMLAAIGDTPYNIVLLLHLFTVIIGTGLVFAVPVIAVQARRSGGKPVQELIEQAAAKLIFPMLLVAGIVGGALVGMSDQSWDFSQTWLAMAGVIWLVVLVLVLAVYPPTWLSLFNLGEDRKRMLGGLLHLSLAIMLIVMVWKF